MEIIEESTIGPSLGADNIKKGFDSVLYGFIAGSKCDFYQSGIRRTATGPFDSPGTTANLLLMRALAERGVGAYDFLGGSSPYKERLATHENPLFTIRAWRPTLRAAVWQSVRLGRRVARGGLGLVARREPAKPAP